MFNFLCTTEKNESPHQKWNTNSYDWCRSNFASLFWLVFVLKILTLSTCHVKAFFRNQKWRNLPSELDSSQYWERRAWHTNCALVEVFQEKRGMNYLTIWTIDHKIRKCRWPFFFLSSSSSPSRWTFMAWIKRSASDLKRNVKENGNV